MSGTNGTNGKASGRSMADVLAPFPGHAMGALGPNSEEAERAVLAGFLLENGYIANFSLEPRLFYGERHQILYAAMAELWEEGEPIDLRTMQARLEEKALFEKAGGISYLANLDLDLPDLGRLDSYVGIIKDRAFRRDYMNEATRMIRAANDGTKDQAALISALQTAILKLQSKTEARTDDFKPLGPEAAALLDEIEATAPGHSPGVTTGFAPIDTLTNGMSPGKFWVLGGRPGAGKTAFALNVAMNQAEAGIPVSFVSLEMSIRGLVVRVLSSGSGVRSRRFLRGYSDAMERDSMRRFVKQAEFLPLYINDQPAQRIEKIGNFARALVAKGMCRVLMLDHLRHILCEAMRSRTEEIAFITRFLVGLAKELDITAVLLAQLNRNIEHRGPDAIPIPSDFEGGGSIEQDADVIAFLHRDQTKDVAGTHVGSHFIAAKNRDGDTGRPPKEKGIAPDGPDLIFDRSTTTFFLPAPEVDASGSWGGEQ